MSRLDFTETEFQSLRQQAQALYSALGPVRCPYFQDHVQFNAQGLEHLRRKGWNRGRKRRDQFMRLKHLARAPEILRLSRTVQGVQETHEWERRRRHGRWEKLLVSVTYCEFVAVLDCKRFKVIVKQVAGGERMFWSLIPFWRQTETGKRILHEGDPAKD